MDRGDWLVVILLFLLPIPLISSNYLINFSAKFMNETRDKEIASFGEHLIKFRKRQLLSALYTSLLFFIALALGYIFLKTSISQIRWLETVSALILTHSVFGKLGWEIQSYAGDTVMELINEWWFRILYSIGIILLFFTMLH